MWLCYGLVKNFGWAIIIFTFIIKAAMFPLNLKQQKSMAVSQLFLPKVQEIQTKYKNNQEKQQEELTKLQKQGYNPTGGCLPMVLTFLILFGVIDVVYKPLTHMEHFSKAQINAIVETAREVDLAAAIKASPDDAALIDEWRKDPSVITLVKGKDENGKKTSNKIVFAEDFDYEESLEAVVLTAADLEAYGRFTTDEYKTLIDSDSRISDIVKNNLRMINDTNYNSNSLYRELRALKAYENPDNRAFFELNEEITPEIRTRIDILMDRMYFGPINLLDQPQWKLDWLLLVPLISFVFSFAQMLVSQHISKKQNPAMANQPGSAKFMLYMMPFISLWIAFTVPAGAGFYWAVSYLFSIIQSVVTAKFWPADKIREEAKTKMDEAAKKTERKAVIIDVDANGNKVEKEKRMSELTQKELRELNRKKLEAARRADAEKYGEEYVESDDDDDY